MSFLQKYQAIHPFEVKYENYCDAMHCSNQVLLEANFLLFAPRSLIMCSIIFDEATSSYASSEPEVKLSVQKRPSRRRG